MGVWRGGGGGGGGLSVSRICFSNGIYLWVIGCGMGGLFA